eukprot:9179631-Alexandrium_andersonii.AAC.1
MEMQLKQLKASWDKFMADHSLQKLTLASPPVPAGEHPQSMEVDVDADAPKEERSIAELHTTW